MLLRMCRLLRFLLLLSVGLGGGLPAAFSADEPAMHYSKPDVRKELTTVVELQLAAFRASDFTKAYTFAAKPLREQMSVRQFTAMITRRYPVIALNKRAKFGLPMDDGSSATMSVEIFADDGESAFYRYTFLKESMGWRVAGVVEDKPRATDA